MQLALRLRQVRRQGQPQRLDAVIQCAKRVCFAPHDLQKWRI